MKTGPFVLLLFASGKITESEADMLDAQLVGFVMPNYWREARAQIECIIGRELEPSGKYPAPVEEEELNFDRDPEYQIDEI
jgi:hypothetical protein